MEEQKSKSTQQGKAVPNRDRERKHSQKRIGCARPCVLTQPVKVMSAPFLLGAMPGLASCQPSREPNDSFDPIRISAKSTLCSLRACTCQLTTRPPSTPTLCASQPCPVSTGLTCRHWVNAGFAESVLGQKSLNSTILQFPHVRIIHYIEGQCQKQLHGLPRRPLQCHMDTQNILSWITQRLDFCAGKKTGHSILQSFFPVSYYILFNKSFCSSHCQTFSDYQTLATEKLPTPLRKSFRHPHLFIALDS